MSVFVFYRPKCVCLYFRSQPTVVHWIYEAVLMAIVHILVICIDNYWTVVSACLLQGILYGLLISQMATIIHEAANQSHYLQALVLNNVLFGFGVITSPFIGGNSFKLCKYFCNN